MFKPFLPKAYVKLQSQVAVIQLSKTNYTQLHSIITLYIAIEKNNSSQIRLSNGLPSAPSHTTPQRSITESSIRGSQSVPGGSGYTSVAL